MLMLDLQVTKQEERMCSSISVREIKDKSALLNMYPFLPRCVVYGRESGGTIVLQKVIRESGVTAK